MITILFAVQCTVPVLVHLHRHPMKLLNLIVLFVSTSLFVAADIAWASDASPEKLNFDSTEDPKSHGRGRLRGPMEERTAFLEPLAEGTARIVREVLPKIESAGMSTNTVAKKAGHVARRARSSEHVSHSKWVATQLDKLLSHNTRFERWATNKLQESEKTLQQLSLDAEVREAKAGQQETEIEIEMWISRLLAKLSEVGPYKKAPSALPSKLKVTRDEATATGTRSKLERTRTQ